MAKIYTANFAPNQKTWTAALSGNSTGTELLVTAGPEGAIVTSVTAMPRETVTASSLLLFLSRYGGTTQRLIAAEMLPAHTMDATTATPITAFEGISETFPIRLEAGDQLFIGTGAAGNIVAFAQSIDYQSRAPEPKNVEPPAIERPVVEGNIATVDVGLWSGYPTPEITVQWLRDGVPIEGATALEYVPTTDDTFLPLSVAVTAANSSGSETVVTQALMVQPDAAVSWLYSDMAETIFVDVDGETPATWGDPVGLIRDASPNRADFTQPTVTARPVLGRVPMGGRRNLLNNTGDLDSWIRFPRAASTLERQEDGWFLWTRLSDDISSTLITRNMDVEQGSAYSLSADIEVVSGNLQISLDLRDNLSVGAGGSRYTLTTGQSLRLESEGLIAAAEGRGFQFRFTSIDTSVPTVLRIRNPQLEKGDIVTPYQRVTSPYDITEAGVEDIHYLSFDLTDDNLTNTLPAIENGTVVIAGTNGIWIDDDYNFAGGTFSIGPTTYTGGPAGILTAIGEPIERGFMVINRQLSQRERELVIQEMKERGAPGVFELGPELYPEGRFEDGIDNIGGVNRGTAEWSDGALKLVTTEVAGTQYGVVATTLNLSSLQSDVPRIVEVAYTSEVADTNQVIRVNRSSNPNAQIIQSGSFAAGSGRSCMYIPVGGVIPYLNLRSEQGSATVGDTFLVQLISIRKLELIP